MIYLKYSLLGFVIAFTGSIVPSYLNMIVVKYSLKSGKKAALYLIGGFATVLFFQANIGAYLSSLLMDNTDYIVIFQKVGTGILILLSINFFRMHITKGAEQRKVKVQKSKAYFHGIGLSLLNTFAIPFYFTAISFLIGVEYFKYSFENGLIFSVGSTIGSFSMYSIYATIASRIEDRLTFIASKMDLILACITGIVGIGNLIFLLK
ncbi:MAG: LysE family transporter [Maribacter sp.]